MSIVFQTLFDSDLLTIRHAVARPASSHCEDVKHAIADLVLMPIAGLFAKHDGPKQRFIVNPSHALFLGREKPYCFSFPGCIGDECLVLHFSQEALMQLLADMVGVQDLYSPCLDTHCLLSAATVLDRELLWRHLTQGAVNPLAIEEISVAMLSASVRAACNDSRRKDRARHSLTMSRRRHQVEIVKEAISLDPAQEWTLGSLAQLAGSSPYHLARVFRGDVGVPVHQYLIRARLGRALEEMRAGEADLTDIALEAGFANHSHFTSSFRSFFGITPSRLRNGMRGD